MTFRVQRGELILIQAVILDAVGTLLRVRGSVGAIYAEAARGVGLHVSAAELEQRFRSAFRRRREEDAQRGHRTDAAWERARWQSIVAEALHELPRPLELFPALWDRFASPDVWEVFPDVAPALNELRRRGLTLAVGSNFDSRLHAVLDGFPLLCTLQPRFVSAEVGWSKPAPEFFAHILEVLKLPAHAVLMVGDDRHHDVEAARAAGLWAVQIARGADDRPRDALASLAELPAWLAAGLRHEGG
jgi:putative hydrolase of the HAD superfamily